MLINYIAAMTFWCLVWLQVGTEDQFPVEWNSQRIIQQQKVCDQANGQKVAGNSDSRPNIIYISSIRSTATFAVFF